MKLRFASFAATAFLLAAPAAHANLLTNGDFGTGDLTGWSENNSCCYYVGTPGDNSYENGQGFHEGAVDQNGMLSQTFSDIAGKTLTVSFDFASNDSSSYQYISFDGNTVAGTLISGPTPYTFYKFTLGVGTGSDTITFNGQNNPDYNWLSNVDVEYASAVPEPASLALLGTGLIAAAGAFRRRKRASKA